MNKDKYATMMARKEIVRDFISKMDSVSVKDVSLIPALMDYVETGNKGMFDEYCDFHFIKTSEEIVKKCEEARRIRKLRGQCNLSCYFDPYVFEELDGETISVHGYKYKRD